VTSTKSKELGVLAPWRSPASSTGAAAAARAEQHELEDPPNRGTSVCSWPPLPKTMGMATCYCPAAPPTARRRAATETRRAWRLSLGERKKLGEEGVGAMEARVEEEIGGGGDSVPFSPCFGQIFLPFPLSTNRLTPCGPTSGEKQRQRPILPRDVASVDSLGEPHGGAAIIPLD
jgi:hypothetical protein